MSKHMAPSIKKYIRRQKALARNRILDAKKLDETITELYRSVGVERPKPEEKK